MCLHLQLLKNRPGTCSTNSWGHWDCRQSKTGPRHFVKTKTENGTIVVFLSLQLQRFTAKITKDDSGEDQARVADLPECPLCQLRCITTMGFIFWISSPMKFLPWGVAGTYTNTLTGLDFNHGANWQLPPVLCRKSLRLNNYNRWLLLNLILYMICLWQFNDRTTTNDPRVQLKEALNENWHWAVDLGYGSKAKMFCNYSFRSPIVTYG